MKTLRIVALLSGVVGAGLTTLALARRPDQQLLAFGVLAIAFALAVMQAFQEHRIEQLEKASDASRQSQPTSVGTG